jgi:hypothetical protein
MLHHDDMEYMGTLRSISMGVGYSNVDRHIHEQNSNDISLEERLSVVLAEFLLAEHLWQDQHQVVRLKPYRPIDKAISRGGRQVEDRTIWIIKTPPKTQLQLQL